MRRMLTRLQANKLARKYLPGWRKAVASGDTVRSYEMWFCSPRKNVGEFTLLKEDFGSLEGWPAILNAYNLWTEAVEGGHTTEGFIDWSCNSEETELEQVT